MTSPPGPPKSWIPGRTIRLMQRDPLGFLGGLAAVYGDVVRFTFGPQPVYLFIHPDAVRDVLVTNGRSFMKGRVLQRSKILLGEGLLTSEGEQHQRQRRLAQPAFHRDRIQHYAETMIAAACVTRDRWRDGDVFDVSREMMRLTLAVVAKTLFDTDVDDDAEHIGAALTDVLELFNLVTNPFAELLQKLPLPSTRRFARARARLDETIYAMIEARRRSGEDRGDLLSMLLLAQDEDGAGGMSDRQVRDEAMTLFLAGHETTANALSWTWYLLSLHPEIEARFHRELEEVLEGRTPVPADFPRLEYTTMVLAESMRLFPPAWAIGRMSTADVEIAGYSVPAKSLVLVSPYLTQRDRRFFAEPAVFDPLRFTAEAKAARLKHSYFPFGGGTRQCIGESFAWSEGVLLLATIGQRWRLELAQTEPVVPKPLITLRPKGGIRMRAAARS